MLRLRSLGFDLLDRLLMIICLGNIFIFCLVIFLSVGGVCLVFPLTLVALLLAVNIAALLNKLLLVAVEILVLVKGMLPQISHIDVDLGLVGLHIIINFLEEQLQSFDKIRAVLSVIGRLSIELFLQVVNEELEVLLVIQDQFRYHSFVDLGRGEFVLSILNDDRSQLSEMLRDLRSTCCHYEMVLISEFLQEVRVVIDTFHQRLRFELSHLVFLLLLGSLFATLFNLLRFSCT